MSALPADDPLIADLTEGELLRAILARTHPAQQAIVGPGDDAAVVATSGSVVATTDTLVHGPDFRLAWSSGYDLGWKAAAVNLADVAAMGARPTALLVALALPRDLHLSFVTQMADGFREACASLAPGCAVVGGDLTVSSLLSIAVTALGDLEGREAITRSGARVGDQLALAGEMGLAARGLQILFSRFRNAAGEPVAFDARLLAEGEHSAVAAQLRPQPPLALGVMASLAGATALMDVSDGLALDATRLARASGVTLDVRRAALGDDLVLALGGGEDHALLATFPPGQVPSGFRTIGEVQQAGEHPLLCDGEAIDPAGWDPYRDWDQTAG